MTVFSLKVREETSLKRAGRGNPFWESEWEDMLCKWLGEDWREIDILCSLKEWELMCRGVTEEILRVAGIKEHPIPVGEKEEK